MIKFLKHSIRFVCTHCAKIYTSFERYEIRLYKLRASKFLPRHITKPRKIHELNLQPEKWREIYNLETNETIRSQIGFRYQIRSPIRSSVFIWNYPKVHFNVHTLNLVQLKICSETL